MSTSIEILNSTDWNKINQAKLNVVVDPMVFRTADVFLRGARGLSQSQELKRPETMWSAISNNIGSLCAFFDAVILEERLPLYDYSMTFPPDLDLGKHTLIEYCNADEEVIVQVTVQHEAYLEIKREAVAVLDKLPPIPDPLANDILKELSEFDWEWRPDLWRDEKYTDANGKRVLDAFQYGGILFSGYAQRTGCDHILHPKRARLYLAASLGTNRADDEKALFAELTRRSVEVPEGVQRTGDMPGAPTFLPYLLKHDDESPRALLKRALRLRKSGIVREYREWRRELLDDLNKGRVLTKRRKEIANIAAAVSREIGITSDNKVNAKIGAKVAFIGPVPVPEIGSEIGGEGNPRFMFIWLWNIIPGQRYRKLLMQLIIAQQEYSHIDKHLRSIWEKG